MIWMFVSIGAKIAIASTYVFGMRRYFVRAQSIANILYVHLSVAKDLRISQRGTVKAVVTGNKQLPEKNVQVYIHVYTNRNRQSWRNTVHDRSTGTRSISSRKNKTSQRRQGRKSSGGEEGERYGIGRGIMHGGVHGAHLIQQ